MQNEKAPKDLKVPSFFAASNSGRGFISYFGKIFSRDRFERVYILKGGPGTGKSSLMKQALRTAVSHGYECESILCSSDPSSYDGVIIKKPQGYIAILDGTAPHTTDPEIPGAVDEIINLGEFWCESALDAKRQAITELIRKKSSCYSCAYAMLKAAESYASQKRKLLSYCIDEEKLSRVTDRILSGISCKKERSFPEYKLKHAISADGYVATDIYSSEDGFHFAVCGIHGAAFAFFDMLYTAAKKKGVPITLSPSPLSPDIYDAAAFSEKQVYFCFDDEGKDERYDKIINTERFLGEGKLREIKPTLRLLSRLERDALGSAIKMLECAKAHHFELEDIYISAMDFEKKEKMQNDLIQRII